MDQNPKYQNPGPHEVSQILQTSTKQNLEFQSHSEPVVQNVDPSYYVSQQSFTLLNQASQAPSLAQRFTNVEGQTVFNFGFMYTDSAQTASDCQDELKLALQQLRLNQDAAVKLVGEILNDFKQGNLVLRENYLYPALYNGQYLKIVYEFIEENKNNLYIPIIDFRFEVDSDVNQNAGMYEVFLQKGVPYSIIMTNVCVQNQKYSEYQIIKLQLIHETIKVHYFLFVRFGKLGTIGQKEIKILSKQNAIMEFHQFFRSKIVNIWEEIVAGKKFKKQPKKYYFNSMPGIINFKQLMQPFDFPQNNKKPYPKHDLEKNLARFLLQICSVQLYESQNDEIIYELVSSIQKQSSQYYKIIQSLENKTEPQCHLDSINSIRQQMMIVKTLFNFEVTSKILLGAQLQSQIQNPLSYCLNSMQIRVQTLTQDLNEYQMINAYIKATDQVYISNIFAVERKQDAELFNHRFQGLTRYLLWYGTKASNLMAILTQGFKIALNTQNLFGEGIYFSDAFCESNHLQNFRYQQFEEQNKIQRYEYIILCEVATGKMKELSEPVNVQNFQYQFQGFNSIKGCGSHIPDPKQQIKLQDDTILPLGKIIEIKPMDSQVACDLFFNQYVIFDEQQAKIKYIVQIDRHPEDQFQ